MLEVFSHGRLVGLIVFVDHGTEAALRIRRALVQDFIKGHVFDLISRKKCLSFGVPVVHTTDDDLRI